MAVPLTILVVAAALRLNCLGCRSLWLDEVTTANTIRQPTFQDALAYAATWTDHTPLHFLLTWTLRGLGSDEFAIRLPYAIAGAIAGVAMYVLGKVLFGRVAGVIAGVLMSVLPFAVYYSQESRPSILLILLTTLLMCAAFGCVYRQRLIDWVALALLGSIALYVGYLAIPTLAAAYGVVWLALCIELIRRARVTTMSKAWQQYRRPIVASLLAAVVTGISFLPWVRHFVAFLNRPDLGFGRLPAGQTATVVDVQILLAQLDLHDLALALAAVGVAVAVIWALGRRWQRALIPLMFLFVPLAGFVVVAGQGVVAIWPRYFSTLYPPAVLLIALGVRGLAEGVAAIWRRIDIAPSGKVRAKAMVVLVALVLMVPVTSQALEMDEAAYLRPKGSDYRGAVERIVSQDTERPVVLLTGSNPEWVQIGLDYYAWSRQSAMTFIDARRLDEAALADLHGATSLWMATRNMDVPMDQAPLGIARTDHADFSLFSIPMASGSGETAARDVLSWVSASEPELARSLTVLDVLGGHEPTGQEILPPATVSDPESGPPTLDRWTLQPGMVVAPDGTGFMGSPAGSQVNAIYATKSLTPGADYLVRFSCTTSDLQGEVRVFVVVTGTAADETFPDGAGEACGSTAGNDEGVIAFTLPQDAAVTTIWVRAIGSGTAGIGPISLRPLE